MLRNKEITYLLNELQLHLFNTPQMSIHILADSPVEVIEGMQSLRIACTIHSDHEYGVSHVLTAQVEPCDFTRIALLLILSDYGFQVIPPSDEPLPLLTGNKHAVIGQSFGSTHQHRFWINYYVKQAIELSLFDNKYTQQQELGWRLAE